MPLTQADIDRAVAAREAYDIRFMGESAAALRRGETLHADDLRILWETAGPGDGPQPGRDEFVAICLERIALYHITKRLKS